MIRKSSSKLVHLMIWVLISVVVIFLIYEICGGEIVKWAFRRNVEVGFSPLQRLVQLAVAIATICLVTALVYGYFSQKP